MSAPLKLENTARRDALIAIEKKYQRVWAEEKAFEVDAPLLAEDPSDDADELRARFPKYFATMAYPYMNGILHAGHSFTLSKAEFATGFERMNGKRALFPLGFHCTGMPIKLAADKIKREVEDFGADFSGAPVDDDDADDAAATPQARDDVTKFSAKKSKAVAKQGRGKFQFEIMLQLGIPIEEVAAFADPEHWLHYFPQKVQQQVIDFGGRVDWRRSMVTTPANPYYDAFVRWQINRLRDCGKIKFGERYTIYSEKDGQACLDHDRQLGEGVNPQEYTAIKIRVVEFAPAAASVRAALPADAAVFFVAATLRPETMYGQTCCFVSPKIEYGVFDAGSGNYYICTERAFKNMSYQKLTPARGHYAPVVKVLGKALVGTTIHAPLAVHQQLRILPMETVLATKGTGVVTCVPLDSPDDYVTTRDLANKPEYYGIKREWVQTDSVAIIRTAKYGDKCAEYLVNELKIQSPKDAVQLAKAKEAAYKEGFYNGTLIYGKYAGSKVEEAKAKVKADLIALGDAFVYNEPEGVVISRLGDDCIVLLEDQWYIDYGEEHWKQQALECLRDMQTFCKETRHGFEGVLDWLKNWAVTRNFGLGTRLPWDDRYLVESLSDSTVYMAYYTIARFLHLDFYGAKPGKFVFRPEQFTDEVFDYIFLRRENIATDIPEAQLKEMRREFEYFYPLDVRVLGKDLIPNHLTFFIYTHVCLFPKKQWPRGIRANGHLMLNNAKMSKLTGNFMTLDQIVDKFGADAARIALADAGDSVEDANFDEQSANAAILRLTTLKEWCEEMVANRLHLRTGAMDSFYDRAFDNEMNDLIEKTYEQFGQTNYKAALKVGLFDYQTARDFYRDLVSTTNGMHHDLVFKYIRTQVLMLAPIAPHFAEYVFRELLEEAQSVQSTPFPRADAQVDKVTSDALEYVRTLSRSIREAEGNVLKKKKGKPLEVDVARPAKLTLFVLLTFPEWQDNYILLVKELYELNLLNDNKKLKERTGKDMKRAMPFIAVLKQRLAQEDPQTVFNRELTFDELSVVKSVMGNIQKLPAAINVEQVQVILVQNSATSGTDVVTGEEVAIPPHFQKMVDFAVPGEPGIILQNL